VPVHLGVKAFRCFILLIAMVLMCVASAHRPLTARSGINASKRLKSLKMNDEAPCYSDIELDGRMADQPQSEVVVEKPTKFSPAVTEVFDPGTPPLRVHSLRSPPALA
jgi:hypothetical protein